MLNNEEIEFSVAEISSAIKHIVEGNFSQVMVRGEISGFTHHSSGHMYMTLKDETSSIRATCWKFNVSKLDIQPEEGMEVIATGKITTYDKNSTYQLNISNLKHAGLGALLKQLEARKAKLQDEGLFDEVHKKPIPKMPKKIGIITSPTGAVIHDIMHRINDRFPTHCVLFPVKVQGDGTRAEVVSAIEFFNNLPKNEQPDVLIVARGGGSIEDLWEFNSEEIARTVFASNIPIISAVGHEPDYTLIDYVSDLRAPTPTGAAELCVPVRAEIVAGINELSNRLHNNIKNRITQDKLQLQSIISQTPNLKTYINNKQQSLNEINIKTKYQFDNILNEKINDVKVLKSNLKTPTDIIKSKTISLNSNIKSINFLTKQILQESNQTAQNKFALLESYSFKKTLERGFSITMDNNGRVVKDASTLKNDDTVKIKLQNGEVDAKVKK